MNPYSTNQLMVEHKVGITPLHLLKDNQGILMSIRLSHRSKIVS